MVYCVSKRTGLLALFVCTGWLLYHCLLPSNPVEHIVSSLCRLHFDMVHDAHTEIPLATSRYSQKDVFNNLQRCSLAVGMSPEVVSSKKHEMLSIASRTRDFLDAFWKVVPSSFDRNFRNPCWFSKLNVPDSIREYLYTDLSSVKSASQELVSTLTSDLFSFSHQKDKTSVSLYCLPSFFVAGFPKTGTTTLNAVLQQHPQILSSRYKEVHWWTRSPRAELTPDYLKLTVVRYLLHFENVTTKIICSPSESITYDASQSTLWDSMFFTGLNDFCALPFIMSRTLLSAKFVVLMRDPISRLYSDFLYHFQSKHGKRVSYWPVEARSNVTVYFHNKVKLSVTFFRVCLRQNASVYECIKETRRNRSLGIVGLRIGIGIYYIHLLKWLQFYPKESFLLLRTEDMMKDCEELLTKITNFLGVSVVTKDEAKRWFSVKYNVQKNVPTNSPQFKMLQETEKLLFDFYAPYNRKLVNLASDKGFLW